MIGAFGMIQLDMTIVSVALPSIQRDMGMSHSAALWIVDAYLLALASLTALGGRLGDMLGKVRTFTVGVAGFALSSLVCALAGNETELISGRALQGIFAAAMIPATASLVMAAFPLEQRGRAMGIFSGTGLAFATAGPLLGGALTEWNWRAIFWLNLPVAMASLAFLAKSRPVDRPLGGRLNVLGAATLVPGLVLIVLVLLHGGDWGWSSPRVLALGALAVLVLISFALAERRAADPIVSPTLLRLPNFATHLVIVAIAQLAAIGVGLFGTMYVQNVLGLSPLQSGVTLLPLLLPAMFGTSRSGRLLQAHGPRWLVGSGLACASAGLLWSAYAISHHGLWLLVPGYALAGIGLSLVMSPTQTDAISLASERMRGQASGVLQTGRQIGGALGTAFLGAVVAVVQQTSPQPSGTAALSHGIAVAILVTGGVMLLGAALAIRNLRQTRYTA
jgi:EmrB/QacA subfamily drug resistance transporter